MNDEEVWIGQSLGHLVEELLLRQHDGGLRVGHEHEHVAVQAVPVDPVVEVGLDVDTRAVDNDHLLPQQPTPLNRPVDHNLRSEF